MKALRRSTAAPVKMGTNCAGARSGASAGGERSAGNGQGGVDRVVHITGFQPAPATATGAVFAAIGQHHALAQGGSQDGLTFIDREGGTTADDLDFKLLHKAVVRKNCVSVNKWLRIGLFKGAGYIFFKSIRPLFYYNLRATLREGDSQNDFNTYFYSRTGS